MQSKRKFWIFTYDVIDLIWASSFKENRKKNKLTEKLMSSGFDQCANKFIKFLSTH